MRAPAAGGNDGCIRVFDLVDGSLVASFTAGHDTINGCAYHPFLPLLSTASGGFAVGFVFGGSSARLDLSCFMCLNICVRHSCRAQAICSGGCGFRRVIR